MAVLKYKDSQGNYLDIVGLNVQNEVVQTTGNSTTSVMSQKAVSDLIPAQASSSNQLADKDFVNSSITTATATYQGSYNLVSDLSLTTQASHGLIEQALNTYATGADNNDYSFVQIPTADDKPTEIAKIAAVTDTWSKIFDYTSKSSLPTTRNCRIFDAAKAFIVEYHCDIEEAVRKATEFVDTVGIETE